jgi:hypothetical protein
MAKTFPPPSPLANQRVQAAFRVVFLVVAKAASRRRVGLDQPMLYLWLIGAPSLVGHATGPTR